MLPKIRAQAIVSSLTLGVLILLLWQKLQLGLVRYFDADEFAYLHWAHNVFIGKRPYLDFLLYVTPGFLWVLAPLFWFFQGTSMLVAGRVFAWLVFVGICGALGVILVHLRGDKVSRSEIPLRGRNWEMFFIPGIILAFLPLPADKFLEIRPDNLATLLVLVGMMVQIKAESIGRAGKTFFSDARPTETETSSVSRSSLNGVLLSYKDRLLKFLFGQNSSALQNASPRTSTLFFVAGLFYGLSLLVLPKTLPQIAVALLVAIGWGIWGEGERGRRIVALTRFFLGLALPFSGFGIWAAAVARDWQSLNTIIYSLTKLPWEINRIAEVYPILQWQFFYPNFTYYGESGWNVGLIANHMVWVMGLLVGVVRLITPFLPNGRHGAWAEILLAGSLTAHVAAFMYGYPLRHAQYLIPIAVFVAFFAADGITAIVRRIGVIGSTPSDPAGLRGVKIIGGGMLVLLAWGMVQVFLWVNRPKLAWTNKEDLATLERMLTAIPKDAYVLDLVGATIYFRDPYYVSAVPFGQWEKYLSRRLPSLPRALEQTNTRYIYQGRLRRVSTLLPVDQEYIARHYPPLGNGELLVRKVNY